MPIRLTVIGSGPGGYQAALRAAQLGAQVTLVERDGLGGVCLHRGCIPTKALLASASALAAARRLGEYGIRLEGQAAPDMPAILARKDMIVATQAGGIEKLLASRKVQLLRGSGSLAAPDMVRVELNAGDRQEVPSDRVILATGSRPADMPALPRDGIRILNSDDALSLARIPASLAMVGGGVVGCELACVFAALGSKVLVIEALDRLLPIPSLDPEASKLLLREFKKQRMDVRLGTLVKEASASSQGVRLVLEPSPLAAQAGGAASELTVDTVIVAVGRALNTQGLGLAELGAELDQRGAPLVDASLRTSLPGVYAVGDLLGPRRPMLAHMASAEGVAAVEQALGRPSSLDHALVPAAAFTFPEVAWVGCSLAQARELGLSAASAVFPVRLLGKAQAMGEIAGQIQLIHDQASGRLLGAHLIGPHASDLIHECALGLKLGARMEDIAHTIHAHPTLSEGLKECAEAALGRCLHLPPGR